LLGENISIGNPIESESTTGRRSTDSSINTDELNNLKRENIQLKDNERLKVEDMKKNENESEKLVAQSNESTNAEVKLTPKKESFQLMKSLLESLNPEDMLEVNEALKTKIVKLTEKNTIAESNLNAKTEELHHTLSHYCKQAVTYEAEVKRLKKEVTELTEKNTNVEAEVKRLEKEVTELTEKNTNVEADRKTKTEELMNTIAQFTDIESNYINQEGRGYLWTPWSK